MKRVLLLSCSLAIAAAMQAQIIHVPGDYPTIQQGINAATPGDTVLVAGGTYFEQINFLGKKPLMVASQFLMDGDTNHISGTIIDGSQITSDTGSVVNFKSGEDTTSVLCGFTVKNGSKGTLYFDSMTGCQVRTGGGVFIYQSGARLMYNYITGNHITNVPGNPVVVIGGGVGTALDQVDHWVIVDHNKIDNNSCTSNSSISGNQIVGGGVQLAYNATITNNSITNNHLYGSSETYSYGGGLSYGPASFGDYSITGVLTNNTISNNEASSANQRAEAGGVLIQASKAVVSANLVENNMVTGNAEGTGGICLSGPRTGTSVSGNRFSRNNSSGTGGGLSIFYYNFGQDPLVVVENNYFSENKARYGGGFYVYENPVLMQNNVFNGNQASLSGGAVYLVDQSTSDIHHLAAMINNSFYGNTAEVHGGAIFSSYGKPLIFNSVFYHDSVSAVKQEIYLNNNLDTVEIAYSDIDFNLIQAAHVLNGGSNINADPVFDDMETLEISEISPCYNTGIDQFTCECGQVHMSPGYDIDGIQRPWYGMFDMGAHEFQAPVHIGGNKLSGGNLGCSVGPNPIDLITVFSYTLREPCQVTITVFDNFGKMVAEPLNTIQSKGKQQVQWNAGNLPAGMYCYRIQAGTLTGRGKLVKY